MSTKKGKWYKARDTHGSFHAFDLTGASVTIVSHPGEHRWTCSVFHPKTGELLEGEVGKATTIKAAKRESEARCRSLRGRWSGLR